MICALLTGCTGPGAPSPAAASLTVQSKPGLRLNTGFVEFGDFTAFDEKLQWIDGCNEIPREVLEAAGMDLSRGVESEKSMSSWVCVRPASDPTKRWANYGLIGDGASREVIADKGILVEATASEIVPGLYTNFMTKNPKDTSCYASVDTVRGRLSIAYSDFKKGIGRSELCSEAVKAYETIYRNLGGENATGYDQS